MSSCVGALFDEFSVVKHADAVGLLDGGEAVGNDKAGAVGAKVFKRFLDESLGVVVERGGGLVEQQQRGIFQQGAGDGEPLFFAAGEAAAALAGDGVEAVGTGADEVGGVGGFEGGPDFLVGGVVFGEQEIFAQRGVEEEAFLGDVAELVAQPFLGNVRPAERRR